MSCLLPSPVRNLLIEPCPYLRSKERESDRPSIGSEFVTTGLRSLLAIGEIAAFVFTPLALPVVVLGGALLSLPATLIAVGSVLFTTGVITAITSASALAFAGIAVGFGLMAAGWLTLHYNSFAPVPPFGLLEHYVIGPVSEKVGGKVSSCFGA